MQNSGQKTKCRLVFFGNEQIATGIRTDAPILNSLIDAGHDIAALVLSDAGTKSRTKQRAAVIELAEQHGIQILQPTKLKDAEAQLKALGADVAVLAAYGKIVSRSIIDLFPAGILNIHPSLLPKHRGSIPIEAALLANETETGVSLMQLAPEMDAGPIFAQSSVVIGDMTKQQLVDTLAATGAAMLVELLPGICTGEIIAAPQDHEAATYDSRISKDVSGLDLQKSARQLMQEIKAYAGWPGSRLVIGGKDCTITRAHVIDNSLDTVDKKAIFVANKQLCAQTSDGILVIDTIKPAGKPDMPAAAFLAGHKHLL